MLWKIHEAKDGGQTCLAGRSGSCHVLYLSIQDRRAAFPAGAPTRMTDREGGICPAFQERRFLIIRRLSPCRTAEYANLLAAGKLQIMILAIWYIGKDLTVTQRNEQEACHDEK